MVASMLRISDHSKVYDYNTRYKYFVHYPFFLLPFLSASLVSLLRGLLECIPPG